MRRFRQVWALSCLKMGSYNKCRKTRWYSLSKGRLVLGVVDRS